MDKINMVWSFLKKILVISIIMTTTVYAKNTIHKSNVVDKQARPYFLKFQKHYKKVIKNMTVIVGTIRNKAGEELRNVAGVCFYRARYVIINKRTFRRTKNMQEAIIFHELGHCELKRKHSDNKIDAPQFIKNDKCPESLMNSGHTEFDRNLDRCYNRHKDYYIDELFLRLEK